MTTSPDYVLAPCPFCGGAPRKGFTIKWHVVGCDNDSCWVNPESMDTSEAEAVQRWNIRPLCASTNHHAVAQAAQAALNWFEKGTAAGKSRNECIDGLRDALYASPPVAVGK